MRDAGCSSDRMLTFEPQAASHSTGGQSSRDMTGTSFIPRPGQVKRQPLSPRAESRYLTGTADSNPPSARHSLSLSSSPSVLCLHRPRSRSASIASQLCPWYVPRSLAAASILISSTPARAPFLVGENPIHNFISFALLHDNTTDSSACVKSRPSVIAPRLSRSHCCRRLYPGVCATAGPGQLIRYV